ncbi:MAG: histidine kinase dimerization/phospho-acceptor domain-containing protein, partial [Phycisphaerae bacterium]
MASCPWLIPAMALFPLAVTPADWLSLALGLAAAGVAAGAALVYRRRLRRTRAELRHLRGRVNVLVQDLDRAKRRTRTLAVMAKSAKAVRNEFLSSISHEVRTPMNTIMGMTDLALSADLDAKPRRYLERVRAAGDALLGLLNDLLDLSKIHARRLRLDVQDFRLRDCIADVVGRHSNARPFCSARTRYRPTTSAIQSRSRKSWTSSRSRRAWIFERSSRSVSRP